MVVSAADQKMVLMEEGAIVKEYDVSTSKFGVGDQRGSYRTPLGRMEVATKIGDGAEPGTVFKSRRPTGEILRPNAPGRDPIVTRIIWLRGTERQNSNAFRRYIYIHGTPQESAIGIPASYGCIRMRSSDIIDLYSRIGIGSDVFVTTKRFETVGGNGGVGKRTGNFAMNREDPVEIVRAAYAAEAKAEAAEAEAAEATAAKDSHKVVAAAAPAGEPSPSAVAENAKGVETAEADPATAGSGEAMVAKLDAVAVSDSELAEDGHKSNRIAFFAKKNREKREESSSRDDRSKPFGFLGKKSRAKVEGETAAQGDLAAPLPVTGEKLPGGGDVLANGALSG